MDDNYLAKKIPYEVSIPTKISDYYVNENEDEYIKIKSVGLGK